MNIYHTCDVKDRTTVTAWSWVYMTGQLRADHMKYADCKCCGSWMVDARLPSSPGEYVGHYNGREVLIVLAYKCPVVISGRMAYVDDSSVNIRDVKSWESVGFTHD